MTGGHQFLDLIYWMPARNGNSEQISFENPFFKTTDGSRSVVAGAKISGVKTNFKKLNRCFLSIHISLVFRFFVGYFGDFIDINSLGAVAFIIVIARPAGVGLFALLAEFSGHGSTSHILAFIVSNYFALAYSPRLTPLPLVQDSESLSGRKMVF